MTNGVDASIDVDEPRNPHGSSLIIPRLYLSDYTIAYDEKELKRLRVTHLVSALGVSPGPPEGYPLPDMPHLKRLRVPVEDSPRVNISAYFDRTTEFIREALADETSVVVVNMAAFIQFGSFDSQPVCRSIVSWASAAAPLSSQRTSSQLRRRALPPSKQSSCSRRGAQS